MTGIKLVAALAVTLALAALAAPVHAQTCDKTFTGSAGDAWHKAASWDPSGAPSSSDVACVNAGSTAMIWGGECDSSSSNAGDPCEKDGTCTGGDCDFTAVGDAKCKAILIKRSGSTIGTVNVGFHGHLAIYGPTTSTIDGVLNFTHFNNNDDLPMSIKLGGDVTIAGNGGDIVGNAYLPFPTIDSIGGGGYTLTLDGFNNSDQDTSIVLQSAWTVNVAVDNDGWVIANYEELFLETAPVTGDGVWAAGFVIEDAGELTIDVAVSGAADWKILDYNNSFVTAKIVFNVSCPNLTGDFDLQIGTLEVNAAVTTTGDLAMKRLAHDPKPTIAVAAAGSIEFGAAP